MDERPLVYIEGIVIASGWAPNGEISKVDIAGYDEKRYCVASGPMGDQLLKLDKQKVIVRGKFVIENQQPVIHVYNFKVDNTISMPDGV